METRIIETDIWRDTEFRKLDDKDAKIILFLLSNDLCTVLPAYHIALDEVAFYVGTTIQKIKDLIPKMPLFGIYYVDEYFILTEKFTRTKYNGGKTSEKRPKVWADYPESIKEIVDIEGNIDQSLSNHSSTIANYNHKPITINHKTENINHKDKSNNLVNTLEINFQEIADKLNISLEEVKETHERILDYEKSTGKRYKDYPATIRNWIRRDKEKTKSSNNFQRRTKII